MSLFLLLLCLWGLLVLAFLFVRWCVIVLALLTEIRDLLEHANTQRRVASAFAIEREARSDTTPRVEGDTDDE